MKIFSLERKRPEPAKALVLICTTLMHLSQQKRISSYDKDSLAYLGAMGLIHTARLSRENRRLNRGK